MTNKEMYDCAKKYGRDDICKFMKDMKRAGLKIEYYKGRFFWHGPAVITDDIQNVMSNTKVRCQYDSMGFDFVVYPKVSLKLINAEN
jgi:hypothetical protein